MKKLGTIILSDIHCGKVFDKKKCDYLLRLFDRAEQVILNGDFWSYYIQDFDSFVNSKWNKLFPALKAKNCVYIHGNHDRKNWCDDRVNLFSVYNDYEYLFPISDNEELYISHGHLISNDSIQNETYIKFNRALFDFNRLNRSYKFYILLNKILLKIFKEQRYSGFLKYLNKPYYEFASNLPENQILVTGHTHAPEFSPGKRYINVGFVNFGLSYFLNIKDVKCVLEWERY